MYGQNRSAAPYFLSSRETYEKYERPHNHILDPSHDPTVPYPENLTVTAPSDYVISEYKVQPSVKSKIPFGRIVAAAIGIPLFIMVFLFIAIWFQELGFI